ncbi:polysaccharide biosynthesis/export family protein [Litoribacter alkaliphilus]|uniref:Polysaccharide biosynthesis/export family protein n=1 Tax=Litoribacter ruber TaxID=702568 RepID=A0AAP2CH05_9BACT|nr:polysaccharide biosynthesis/export family protein [Litoribacter alkaliphilus]MBS9524521.1 polysaccharide biosynthesis/export family protein [Litoribacter alkaliphilus]
MKNLKIIFHFLIIFSLLSSCVNTRKATYFNDLESGVYHIPVDELEPVLQKSDLLSISVSSLNPMATEIFNASNVSGAYSSTATGLTANAAGYLIDKDGFINFPYLGKLHAEGKTKKELTEEITAELLSRKLLVEPMVNIRYLNYKVSVLGEVAKPSVLTIPNEKVSILEAIGLAGDLTIYAKRNNVLLIRDQNGVKKVTRIDLTTDEIFKSPYYYLESNDVIYVEPNRAKVSSTNRANQWLPAIIGSVSLLLIGADRFIR